MKGNFFGSVNDRKPDRWNRDSEAGRMLKSMIENGDIDPSDPPKAIWDAYPIFQQYDLAKFRAALNKMKAELGVNVRIKKGDGDDDDNNGGVGGAGGRFASVGGYQGAGSNNVGGTGNVIGEEVGHKCGWMPIHTVFEWCDVELRDRLTLLVVMPGGVNEKYSLAVVGGGTKVEISVMWPQMMVDCDVLHEPFKTKMLETSKVQGLDATWADYLQRLQQFKIHINGLERKLDRFESKCCIELPKTVHAHQIETNAIGRKDGTRLLYINLVCECTDSNKQKGKDFFIV